MAHCLLCFANSNSIHISRHISHVSSIYWQDSAYWGSIAPILPETSNLAITVTLQSAIIPTEFKVPLYIFIYVLALKWWSLSPGSINSDNVFCLTTVNRFWMTFAWTWWSGTINSINGNIFLIDTHSGVLVLLWLTLSLYLSRDINLEGRGIDYSKLTLDVNESVTGCLCLLPCNELVICPGCSPPLAPRQLGEAVEDRWIDL